MSRPAAGSRRGSAAGDGPSGPGAAVAAEIRAMRGPEAPPRRNGELVFEAPWQGRAFGLALALVQRLGVPWRAFQKHLIAEIAAHPDAPYYDCWVAALERLVLEHRVASREDLERAGRAVGAAGA